MSEAVRECLDSNRSNRSSRSGTSQDAFPCSESSKEEAAGDFLDVDMGNIVHRLTASASLNSNLSLVNEAGILQFPEVPFGEDRMEGDVLSKKANVGTLTQSTPGGNLQAYDVDSTVQNETHCYISGDTASGVLNYVERFLVNLGVKIAPKVLRQQALEASFFNNHQICSFMVAISKCNKQLRCYDSDDSTLPSTENQPHYILHFGMRFGDKDQFYCIYHRTVDSLLSSGRVVREKFGDGLKFSQLSAVPIDSVDGDQGLQQPLGISGPPPLPSKLRDSRMGHVSEVLVGQQPPLAEVLQDMLVGDSSYIQFEAMRMVSMFSTNNVGRSFICASNDSILKSLMQLLVCFAEDIIVRPKEDEGDVHMKTKCNLEMQQHRGARRGNHLDSFAALFAMRAISSLVRVNRILTLVDSNIFQSLFDLCSYTIFLPSSIEPVDGDAGSATSRYWEDLACIEAQMQGALAAKLICQAAETSVIDDRILAKCTTTRYEILKAIALCSCMELVPYLSRMLRAWQCMLNKRRPVRELTEVKITPAPYISVVGSDETTREFPGLVMCRVRGEFPTLFATITRFLSTLDGTQWDDGKPTSKLQADVNLQPPHPLWAVTMYTTSQYCEMNVSLCHSSDSETGKEYLVKFQLKSGGKVEFFTLINMLSQLIRKKTDLTVMNLEGVESRDGLILLSSPHNVPSSTILDGPNASEGRPYFGDANDSAERLFAVVCGSKESLPRVATRLLLRDDGAARLQGARLVSFLTATQSTQERLCSGAEIEIVELVEALVYVSFQKGNDEVVDGTVHKSGTVSTHPRVFAIMALSQMIGGPNRNVKACNALANTNISVEQAQDCACAVARTYGAAEALQKVLSCHRLGGKGV